MAFLTVTSLALSQNEKNERHRFTTTTASETDSIPCAQLDLEKDRASLQPVPPHSLRVGASCLHGATKAGYNDESGGTPMRT